MPNLFPNWNWHPSKYHPQFIYWAWYSVVQNISLASSGQLFCAPSHICFASSLLEHRKLKSTLLRVKIVQQQPKWKCGNNIVLILNPNHITVDFSVDPLGIHFFHHSRMTDLLVDGIIITEVLILATFLSNPLFCASPVFPSMRTPAGHEVTHSTAPV